MQLTLEDINALALKAYPEDIHETSKGCFDDMNAPDRSTWMEGAIAIYQLLNNTTDATKS